MQSYDEMIRAKSRYTVKCEKCGNMNEPNTIKCWACETKLEDKV